MVVVIADAAVVPVVLVIMMLLVIVVIIVVIMVIMMPLRVVFVLVRLALLSAFQDRTNFSSSPMSPASAFLSALM